MMDAAFGLAHRNHVLFRFVSLHHPIRSCNRWKTGATASLWAAAQRVRFCTYTRVGEAAASGPSAKTLGSLFARRDTSSSLSRRNDYAAPAAAAESVNKARRGFGFGASALNQSFRTDWGDNKTGRYNVLFCGTDDFALRSLQTLALRPDLCRSIQVLTPDDAPNTWRSKKQMRVSPVKVWANDQKIPHYNAPAQLDEWELPAPFDKVDPANVLVTASFGRLIPAGMMASFPRFQRLNVHPSLLPQLRGAAPVQWAIARRMTETGISIQTLGETFDSGDILAQEDASIPYNVTTPDFLEKHAKVQAAELLIDVISNLPRRAAQAWSQSENRRGVTPSFAPKIRRENCEIKWNKWSAGDIAARARAMQHVLPLTTHLQLLRDGKRKTVPIRILQCRELMGAERMWQLEKYPALYKKIMNAPIGAALYLPHHKRLVVRCQRRSFYGKAAGARREKGTAGVWHRNVEEHDESLLIIDIIQSSHGKPLKIPHWIVGYESHAMSDDGLMQFVDNRFEDKSSDTQSSSSSSSTSSESGGAA